MPNYIVDPTLFYAEGAVVNWSTAARRLGIQQPANLAYVAPAAQPVVQLRWMLRATAKLSSQTRMGLPTEPFMVWQRPHGLIEEKPLVIEQRSLLFSNQVAVRWTGHGMSHVTAVVNASGAGLLIAYAGAPALSSVVGFAIVPAGSGVSVSIAAPIIEGLLFSNNISVISVTGMESGPLAQASGWKLIERVGLPVKQADWNGIGKHGEPQGLTGAITDAPSAAIARLNRGAPPIGWAPDLAAGVPAPPWTAPDFAKLVDEVNVGALNDLKAIAANYPPNQQGAQKIAIHLPPPENSSGQQMSEGDSVSQVSPLALLLMAASTDPFLNLVLGFGTAYPYAPESNFRFTPRFDYMITAHYERGLDGVSGPADYAAIVPTPGTALAPPPPANLVTPALGILRPLATNGSWRATTRLSWDRTPLAQLFRTASFAAARAGITPHIGTAALMDKRDSGGFRTIAINDVVTDPPDPEHWRIHAVDRELSIPINPGSLQLKYGVAIQDIYGQWTPWSTADTSVHQPALDRVRIVKATLLPRVPASGTVCATSLEIEFLWDWRIRSLEQVTFVGNLYLAATTGSPPPSLSVPPGLARSIAGAQPAFVLNFNGADQPAAAAGVSIIALNEAGDAQVAFGAAQGHNRRIRVTLSGFSLDFGPTGHVGLALWTRGQEHVAPQRVGPWSEHPAVISSSDPRPPVVPVAHVLLGSLPDSSGQSHAKLGWTAQPNAGGYFVYEAAETTLLQANHLSEATPDQTLDDRLLILKNAFHANPSRLPFTRMNATLLQGTSTDVTMPRGSTSIHVYVVLAVSAGQVESDWPAGATPESALMAIAAPHVMRPAAPTIEVSSFFDPSSVPPAYKAKISIATRPGPRPRKIELHRVRVDDAAKEVDSMGPAILRLQPTAPSWTVTQAVDTHGLSFIATAIGQDTPSGSWRRVWYRATAWTGPDPTRGGLPGRSPASNAAWVVLPPSSPPVLSTLAFGGSPDPADVVVEWTCVSPRKKTPLGPHKIAVRAALPGAPPKTAALFALDSTLDQLGSTAPAGVSGVWIVSAPGASPVIYRALIHRVASTDVINFAVRITDPVGRMGEQLATVPGGPITPPPDLSALTLQKMVGSPPRVLLSFSTSVPLVAPLEGPYSIKVVATFRRPFFIFPAPVRTIQLSVGGIPTVMHPAGPAPDIQIARADGPGPIHSFTVSTLGAVVSFEVTVTAPDGSKIKKTQVVS